MITGKKAGADKFKILEICEYWIGFEKFYLIFEIFF